VRSGPCDLTRYLQITVDVFCIQTGSLSF